MANTQFVIPSIGPATVCHCAVGVSVGEKSTYTPFVASDHQTPRLPPPTAPNRSIRGIGRTSIVNTATLLFVCPSYARNPKLSVPVNAAIGAYVTRFDTGVDTDPLAIGPTML